MVDREDRHARRLEAHLHVPGDGRRRRPQPEEYRSRRRDGEARRSGDQVGLQRLADRNGDLLVRLPVRGQPAIRLQRHDLAVLLEGGGEAGQYAVRGVNREGQCTLRPNLSGDNSSGSRPARNHPTPPPIAAAPRSGAVHERENASLNLAFGGGATRLGGPGPRRPTRARFRRVGMADDPIPTRQRARPPSEARPTERRVANQRSEAYRAERGLRSVRWVGVAVQGSSGHGCLG